MNGAVNILQNNIDLLEQKMDEATADLNEAIADLTATVNANEADIENKLQTVEKAYLAADNALKIAQEIADEQ